MAVCPPCTCAVSKRFRIHRISGLFTINIVKSVCISPFNSISRINFKVGWSKFIFGDSNNIFHWFFTNYFNFANHSKSNMRIALVIIFAQHGKNMAVCPPCTCAVSKRFGIHRISGLFAINIVKSIRILPFDCVANRYFYLVWSEFVFGYAYYMLNLTKHWR